ncbi:protein CUSTOS-like [Actinia tenebrosa]|uniref:Protein CUSTOS n=1 Tax=Actinia tenebrosa TaxID=6105 RepID=A0A6P8H7T5_ACTTE|nr:protein CUSTOS-like [Actinia tenebrosa]
MASSSSEEDEEERKIMAEIAGCAAKDLTEAHLVIKQMERENIKKSGRNEKDCDEETQSSNLTPEIKRHIAKKLSSYLDGCIQIETGCTFKQKKIMSQVSGIHLFCLSKNKLLDVENDYLKEKQPKTPKRSHQSSSSSESSDNEEDLTRFQEATVCGQSIIDNSCPSIDNGVHRENSNKKKKKKKKKKDQNKVKNKNVSEYEFDNLKDRWKEKYQN